MDVYLALSNVVLRFQTILKITFYPIFKNTEVSLKDVGQHMQDYTKEHNIFLVINIIYSSSPAHWVLFW